jgi:hypothetical protein
VINISVSARSLAAARSIDPDVSPAAVRAAVEVAIAEHLRELRRSPVSNQPRRESEDDE